MQNVNLRLFFVLFVIAIFQPEITFAGPLDNLQPGQWYEVPNSHLSRFYPNPLPRGLTGPAAVMSAWGDGAYDTLRNRLIIHGGGHADYSGNEIYVFDINSLSWSRPWGPSLLSSIPLSTALVSETYLDGNPTSVHTYAGMVYLPTQDKLWRAGGSLWSGSGQGSRATWIFDFNTLSWQRGPDSPYLGVSQIAAYDTATGSIFALSDRAVIAQYNPFSNTWTKRLGIDNITMGEEMTAAVDPAKGLFIAIGNGKSIVYDIKANTARSQPTTGPQNVMNARGPGLVYDPVLKKIVGWAGGTSVYSLDTSTWTWAEHPAASTNVVAPTSPTRVGVFGRFQYIPAANAYILVNSTEQNVFLYRLSPSSTTPPSSNTQSSSNNTPPSSNAQSSSSNNTSSGWINIPLKTWSSRPAPAAAAGPYPSPYEGKHSRLLFDSKRGRMVLAGGDYEWTTGTLDGSQLVWAIDLSQGNTWTPLSPYCNTASPIQPGGPDTVGWAYDSKRDRAIMTPGFYFMTQGQYENIGAYRCKGAPLETKDAVSFDFSSNKWQERDFAVPPSGWGGDLGSSYSTYDPNSDAVYRFRGSGVEIFSLSSGTYERVGLTGVGTNPDFNRDMPAIDVQGRSIYIISRPLKTLLKYSIPNKQIVESVPLPQQWSPPQGSDMESYITFDPINRVVLNPVTHDFNGQVFGLAVYHVDTKTWEWESVPTEVSGNSLGFDAAHNVLMLMGRSASNVFWLYRYGDGNSSKAQLAAPTDLQVQ